MFNTNKYFKPGKLTTIMDLSYGSSGKGKVGAFVTEHADNWTFACNAFFPNAGHWVRLDDGREYFYQQLNSCAYQDKYEKIYIGPSSLIELPALLNEIEKNKVNSKRLGVSPLATLVLQMDMDYEKGLTSFNEERSENHSIRHEGTSKHGSTGHGCGSAGARKMLRRSTVVYAKDIPELQPYLCNVSEEIVSRLERGEAGLLEIAQGFTLSLNGRFHPACTSRNVLVSQGLSDMFLPPKYAGPVVLNMRTYPIRINSKKFIAEDGRHLTWAEVQSGVPHTVYEGNSGGWYPDQHEITWEELTERSGAPQEVQICELTSVTKLPRRIATFSAENVEEAIKFNNTGDNIYLSMNFVNYVDYSLSDVRGNSKDLLSNKFKNWESNNLSSVLKKFPNVSVDFYGTGARTDDMIFVG